jgi:hypothetical protein
MKIIYLLFLYVVDGFILLPMHKNIIMNNKNGTKDDCALIPKKDIPRHPLIWQPSTYYIKKCFFYDLK